VGADLYSQDDAALLSRVASLVTPQVALLVASAGTGAGDRAPGAEPAAPAWTAAIATLLATCSDIAEVIQRIRDLAARVLPFDEMRYAMRLSEGDRVVMLVPGERRPLPDLPLVPVAGTTLGDILAGASSGSFVLDGAEATLLVPLRVAGRIHGALVLTARHPAVLREAHLAPAQQLADIVAPHLELLRRAALLPPPYLPGWKRTQRNQP
jgi:hypothetical protein